MSAQTRAGRCAVTSAQPASTTSHRLALLIPALRDAEQRADEPAIRAAWDGIADAATEPGHSN
ncbi:MAG TPA: hypothetical protein VHX38_02760 [Pseudonocardiaceae bacterium]|jgi:hypothetical protein|nr:hypothetical protein [Pseudonocardiaceae bacterium]